MTPTKPTLFLKRLLVVSQSGKAAYDETFHSGLNIIRGRNSSGKSTIANFIFYALGGNFSNWTTEALRCREVLAEVEICGATLTLRRTVALAGTQPMSIFWGAIRSAQESILGWDTYPYSQTEDKISFSRVLFGALTFPEVRSDDSNITMHQILRLLYADQDTSPLSLFRSERFDIPLTRETTAELLLGIYEDTIYSDRLELKSVQAQADEKSKQFEAITKVFGMYGDDSHPESVAGNMQIAISTLQKVEANIKSLREGARVTLSKKTELHSETLQKQLLPLKEELRTMKERISLLELDILDSEQFIEALKSRQRELTHSLLTRAVLGELPLTHCPQCLSPLANDVGDGVCILCKKPLDATERTVAKRLVQEMDLQVRESLSLLDSKRSELSELNSQLPVLTEKARRLQKQLNQAIEEGQSVRDERLDTLLVEKGGLEKRIEFLERKLGAVKTLQGLREDLERLAGRIAVLKNDITAGDRLRELKRREVMSTIEKFALGLLANDLPFQSEFQKGQKVEIDFARDTYKLDGANNFSASSKIYFKNCILYSLFFSSLSLDFVRYPRFILCDNMEDKGMEEARSQNFQENIATLSTALDEPHQIIFTTSMISQSLNTPQYCVGEFYTADRKSLNFS